MPQWSDMIRSPPKSRTAQKARPPGHMSFCPFARTTQKRSPPGSGSSELDGLDLTYHDLRLQGIAPQATVHVNPKASCDAYLNSVLDVDVAS